MTSKELATSKDLETRSIDKVVEIEAPAEAVWAAITEAEELTRWFPLEARTIPGPGGKIWISWGEEFQGEKAIDEWEPNRRLKASYRMPDANGQMRTVTEDWILESRGGRTLLRLVNSGFSTADSWDEQYDGIRRGWDFELFGLKHYLERHRGTPRRVVWARGRLQAPLETAWCDLMSPKAFLARGSLSELIAGDRYGIETATGLRLEGTVVLHGPPRDFAAIVQNLGDAYLRLRLDVSCNDVTTHEINLWLSTFGISASRVTELQEQFDSILAATR